MTGLFPRMGRVAFGGGFHVTRNLLISGVHQPAQKWAAERSTSPLHAPPDRPLRTRQQPHDGRARRIAGIARRPNRAQRRAPSKTPTRTASSAPRSVLRVRNRYTLQSCAIRQHGEWKQKFAARRWRQAPRWRDRHSAFERLQSHPVIGRRSQSHPMTGETALVGPVGADVESAGARSDSGPTSQAVLPPSALRP